MVDLLLGYALLGATWATWVEVFQRKGFISRAGIVIFFPFVATTMLGEIMVDKIRKFWYS